MVSETRILCHFLLVLLSSTLMKQLTRNVGIISYIYIYIFLVWIFNGCDLFQVTVTDAYIVCSYFKTFEEITLYSTYLHCLLHCWHHLMLFWFTHVFIGFWLSFIIQFISTFNLSCTDHAKLGQ